MFLSSLIYIHLFFFFLSIFFIGISSLSKYSKLKNLSYGILIINMFISLISYLNFESIKFEKKKIYSFDEIQRMSEDQLASGMVESGNHLMKTIQNGVNSDSFTAAQLAQFLDKLSLNKNDRKLVNDVIANGSTAANKVQMKKIWGNIWTSYSSNSKEYVKNLANTSQLYNLNDIVKDWTMKHQGSKLTELYNTGDAALKLEQATRVDAALMTVRQENYNTIKKKFTEDLTYIVKEVKEKDPEAYRNVTQAKIDQAVNLMINRYVLDGKGHTEEFNKIAPEVDKQISSILGFTIGKTTNRPSEAKWYNYVFPLTNIPRMLGDGREDVHETASWVSDVFDNSFEELTNIDPDKGGLKPYSSDIIKSDVGNHYEFKSNRERELKIEKTNSQLLYFYMGSTLLGLLSIVGLWFEYYQVKIRTYFALLILLVSITITVSLTIALVNKTFSI